MSITVSLPAWEFDFFQHLLVFGSFMGMIGCVVSSITLDFAFKARWVQEKNAAARMARVKKHDEYRQVLGVIFLISVLILLLSLDPLATHPPIVAR